MVPLSSLSTDLAICVKYFRIVLRGREAKIFEWSYLIKHCSHLNLKSKNTVQLFLRSKFFKFSDIKFSMFKLSQVYFSQ